MWYVYILRCENGSLYTGITKDVQKRFLAHKSGTASKYTRAHPPTEVLFTEEHPSRSEASKREYEIKQYTVQQKLELLKNDV
ncbi:GIY-YIG nuclease family protein [candidate division WWE3 bacterium]|uniref:GIY-YIG nuclease family protein n=1 Tax=candidate division WWE3 bacterium TaxID=2053526 RepID=A0A955RQG9_UNCKA|nr:GIY-YIG nuclease family protein [candidate division WWE3 bacterium]